MKRLCGCFASKTRDDREAHDNEAEPPCSTTDIAQAPKLSLSQESAVSFYSAVTYVTAASDVSFVTGEEATHAIERWHSTSSATTVLRFSARVTSQHDLHGEPVALQIERIQQALQSNRCLAAEQLLRRLAVTESTDVHGLAKQLPQYASLFLQLVPDVVRAADEVAAAYACMDDVSGMKAGSTGRMKSWYRAPPVGSTVHTFKFEVPFTHRTEELVALGRELDLMSTWNRYMLDTLIIDDVAPFEVVGYAGMWFPPPFQHRQALVRGRGWNVLEEKGAIVFTAKSVDYDQASMTLPAGADKRMWISILDGTCCVLQPITDTHGSVQGTHCKMIFRVDPHIPSVPAFIISFVLKVLAPVMVSMADKIIAKTMRASDSDYARRMSSRAALYDVLSADIASAAQSRCLLTTKDVLLPGSKSR